MNHRYFIILLVAIVTTFQTRSVAQRFSLGLMSGVNFSHPHGDFTTGKWESRNGPVVGISFQYKLTNILSLQTELNYTSLYFKRLGYKDNTSFISGGLSYSSFYDYRIYPYFSSMNEKWDLNFFRVPLLAKLSTPTKLKFEFAGGVYWSFLNSSAYSGPYPYYLSSSMYPPAVADLYLPAYSGSIPDKDFGYLFTAGFSYPLSKSFRTSLTGRYFIGDKQFFESVKGRTGAFELNLGIVYTGFFSKKEDKEIQRTSIVDSIPPKFHISFRGGAGIAYVIGDIGSNSYHERKGTIFGMALKYDLSKFLMLETELMYERKGYKLNDQSGSYFYYTSLVPKNVNTLIDLDYLEIPILLRFETGNKVKFFLHTGPYVAFLISGRVTGISEWENRSDYGYYHNKTTVYDRIDGNLQNRDLGITTGGGVRFPIYKNLMFELECRYNAGMKNILEDEPYQTGDVDRLLKNQSFLLTAGVVLPIFRSE